jgi:hypothetical protein
VQLRRPQTARLQNDGDLDLPMRIPHGGGLSITFDPLKSDRDRTIFVKKVAPPILLVRKFDLDGHFVAMSLVGDGRRPDRRPVYVMTVIWPSTRRPHRGESTKGLTTEFATAATRWNAPMTAFSLEWRGALQGARSLTNEMGYALRPDSSRRRQACAVCCIRLIPGVRHRLGGW